MEVQERGTMRWVSPMLPEHVELLKEVFVEYKEKPILNEQKMNEIDQTLKYALKHQVNIEMTYYKEGEFLTLSGKLVRIDQRKGYIVLWNEDGFNISLTSIIDVEIV
ncbi:YolD-like family protein [Pseudogracilibacillus auburnensis]|uniref:YolD-like protein n=1 Tax=Pseudogracilibacillus auburnensis TaxID=1494959 RepID=A0A2V3VI04_9BACI|nr:YolD-like family protein [Pseudogracilibacillus auburnensis]PXW80834.1 YolD-like protein [Pseudogracilibacillus auburnensis]